MMSTLIICQFCSIDIIHGYGLYSNSIWQVRLIAPLQLLRSVIDILGRMGYDGWISINIASLFVIVGLISIGSIFIEHNILEVVDRSLSSIDHLLIKINSNGMKIVSLSSTALRFIFIVFARFNLLNFNDSCHPTQSKVDLE